MHPRNWIALTLLLTLGVGGVGVLANVRADIYGLFRSDSRQLPLYDSERRGKYLLSHRYVPEHFAGILLGSSVTSAWNTAGIHGYDVYNESSDGGNITEQKLLAETVLRRSRGLKLAICAVHPYLTDSHGLAADEMGDAEYWGALGSLSLLRAYQLRWKVQHGREDLVWDALGTEHRDDPRGMTPLSPALRRILQSTGEIAIDPVALEEYRVLVGELRARGVRLVAVVPPLYEPLLAPTRDRLDRYTKRVLGLFSPADLVVDFNAPEYLAFRQDAANYRDGVHLTRRGSDEIVRLLDARIAGHAD
jgi:hypothetical protein